MTDLPILETQRLILRPPNGEDREPWLAFAQDEKTMTHLGGVQEPSVAWRGLCTMAGSWHVEGFSMFSVLLRDSGKWIGRIGPWRPYGWPGNEVGWGIASAYEGKGYASEAAAATMDYACDVLGWDEIIHCIVPDNHSSIALAKRLGSRNLGKTQMPAPFHNLPVDKWGQSKAEWLENRKKFQ